MDTILAFAATQPTGEKSVSQISASGFYWFLAFVALAAVVVGFFVIRNAVLSALRRHAKESRP